MTTEVLVPLLTPQFFANNGSFLVGGQLFSYQAGTSTPASTYTDSTGATPNANPIILNSRGEASIWIPPNVGYKFVLEDAAGNTIWSRDQVFSSQLLTLYAGVDTGIANAYVVNFAANFSAYSDGIVLYFIPANSNTGASTINVNGLGVISIINQNGSALAANELLANQVATIMYKGGSFLLIQGAQQGLVSYGSTDTGTANAYVVGLTNQYFAYQAGNVLFWIPANTNTGASTINVKGLGAQNIFGAGGGALPAGILSAGALSEIVYTGSYFRLVYPTAAAPGTFTLTPTGFVSNTPITVKYFQNDNAITLIIPSVTGTSNATTFTLTGFPNALQGPVTAVQSGLLPAEDNSALGIAAYLTIPNQIGGSTVQVNINNASGNWTNSGTKTLFQTTFTYFID